jgi:drug/metabolite transporter (DMT)-like permease
MLGALCDAIAFFSLLGLLSVGTQLCCAGHGTGICVDAIGARFLLGGHVHRKRWLGVILVAVGVLLTVQSGQEPTDREFRNADGDDAGQFAVTSSKCKPFLQPLNRVSAFHLFVNFPRAL